MELKILEHCCYRKYLNEWWKENEKRIEAYARLIANDSGEVGPMPEDSWTLIQYGDHTLIDLLDWCINMCHGNGGAHVTIAMPVVTQQTIDYLKKNKTVTKYDIISREMFSDVHTQIATVTNGDRHFVLQNSLLQGVCPGKYITTLGITERYYSGIQPLLKSWMRLYAKKN